MTPPPLARALAAAYLAAPWDVAGLAAAGREVTGVRRPWLTALAEQVLELYHRPPRDRPRELAATLAQLPAFPPFRRRPTPVVHRAAPTAMVRNPWALPHVDTVGALAGLLGLSPGELAWFADVRGLERTAGAEPLRHYRSTRPAARRPAACACWRRRSRGSRRCSGCCSTGRCTGCRCTTRRTASGPAARSRRTPRRTRGGPSSCGSTSRASSPR